MLWSRKSALTHERNRHAGVDVTASRVLGVSTGSGKLRPIVLDAPHEELLLVLAMDRRTPEAGRVGYEICRKFPHTVCSNFLPLLGQTREWRVGRNVLNPESALESVLSKVRTAVVAESESAVLALPPYLSPLQVARVVAAATRTRFPLKGTVVGPLALVAARAAAISSGKPVTPDDSASDWVIPLRSPGDAPGIVVVVEVDEFALSAVAVAVEREQVRLLSAAHWPRFSQKAWKERLLDAVSDRCVRLCRRDPRDSADAEQLLFLQLDEAQDRARAGQRVSLTVRTAHWFQDVILQPEEFDAQCVALAQGSSEAVRELVSGLGLPVPPRDIWLTHEANRLPGFFGTLRQDVPAGTVLNALPRDAIANAAAMLVPRWLAAELPRAHLDSVIPIPDLRSDMPVEKPKTGRG